MSRYVRRPYAHYQKPVRVRPQGLSPAGVDTVPTHATTGTLAAQAATMSGTAVHRTLHATTGSLASQVATVAGTSTHKTLHATSGALASQAASMSGTAADHHAATGSLASQVATISGVAAHAIEHETSGSLASQAASMSGVAQDQHASTGSLSSQAASISGVAAHHHATTGDLDSDAATISGTSAHYTLHATTGALASDEATISGVSEHSVDGLHPTTGDLASEPATMSGEASVIALFVETVPVVTGGPSKRWRYIVHINGRRYIGEYHEIQALIEAVAEKDAEKIVKGKPKKSRIIVQVGKPVQEYTKGPEMPALYVKPDGMLVQAEIRRYYETQLALELLERQAQIDEDDEEVLLLL